MDTPPSEAFVQEIYITDRGSAPMQLAKEVDAIQGRGLAGDRYLMRTGYWTGVDECQVTLIEGEDIDWIAGSTEVKITNGQHRRNIITRGIRLQELAGKRFSVGDAVLEFDRPRPPCRYIQSVSEHGMTKALGARRGGICARVVVAGKIRANDPIKVLERQESA